jgi:hypothetical protein
MRSGFFLTSCKKYGFISFIWYLFIENTKKRVEHTERSCIDNRALNFKNRVSHIEDGRTATLQMLHFIYFFQQI